MKTIQSRLVWARKKAKLSQAKVAKAVEISQPTYSDLERGDSKSSAKLVEIANVLGVNPVWLATGEGTHEVGELTKSHHDLTPEQNILLAAVKGLLPDEMVTLINKAYELKSARADQGSSKVAKDGR